MTRNFSATVVGCLIICVQAVALAKDDAKTIDLSTPQAASKAFAHAQYVGDAAGLKMAGYFPKDWSKLADAWAERGAVRLKLSQAISKKWGKDNVSMFPGLEEFPPTFNDELKINGDHAAMVSKDMPDIPPTESYIKIDGKWKVDYVTPWKDLKPDLNEMLKTSKEQTEATKQFTERVAKNEFKTVDDAVAAYRKALGFDN